MIALSAWAEQDVIDLLAFFEASDRLQAVRNLGQAVSTASERIAGRPGAGLPAPRPYPRFVAPGQLWLKQGRYWISYAAVPPHDITGVHFETADIPRRVERDPGRA